MTARLASGPAVRRRPAVGVQGTWGKAGGRLTGGEEGWRKGVGAYTKKGWEMQGFEEDWKSK